MRVSRSRALLGVINVLILTFLWHWVDRHIHFATLYSQLAAIPPMAVVTTIAINLATLWVYGWRMAQLLQRPIGISFAVVNIGYALNAIMPLRLGDALKIYLSRRLLEVPATSVLAASVAEKIVDVLALLALGASFALFAASVWQLGGALVTLAMAVALLVTVILVFRAQIVRIYWWLPKRSHLRRVAIELHKHSRSYPVPRVLLLTAAIWAGNVALTYVSFNQYIPSLDIAWSDAVVMLLIMAMAIAVPSAPAGLGIFEAGIVSYLTGWLDVGKEAALSAAVVFHLAIVLPQLVLTAIWLWLRRSRTG